MHAPTPRRAPRSPSPKAEKVRAGGRLFVLDTHALCYQSFHALPPMNAPDGRPVQAVYGVVRAIQKLLREEEPEYLLAAFDAPGPTFRHRAYEAYKANRAEVPEDLRPQFDLLRETLALWGIPTCRVQGFEADDILATIARQAASHDLRTHLVTTDKDCGQLLDDRTVLVHPQTGQMTDADAFRKTWGVRPDQMADLLTLAGDASDNIPGVEGIGPKTAASLLERFGTLDALLERLAEVPERARKAIAAHRDDIECWRGLARLRSDVPVHLDLESARAPSAMPPPLRAHLESLSFHSILGASPGGAAPAVRTGLVDTADALAALASRLRTLSAFAIDTETTGLDPRSADLVGISLSWTEGEAVYLPIRAPSGERTLPIEAVREALGGPLGDPAIRKVGQNLKYDIQSLRRAGLALAGIRGDTMITSHLLRPHARTHDLGSLAIEEFGERMTEITEILPDKGEATLADVPVRRTADYAGADAAVAWRLHARYEERLRGTPLEALYRDVEIPLVPILADMEWHGISVDGDALLALSGTVAGRLGLLETEAHRTAGETFNPSSPKQLANILFGRLGLPARRKTKTGPSTDSDVLESLSPLHPLPGIVLEHRRLAKIRGTYLEALPSLVSPATGRLHTTFHQAVTATGRLSSSDPNLQNIPVRTDLGRKIREAFRPRDAGHVFLCADYSQVELRVLAHLSADETLTGAFLAGADIHDEIARQLFTNPQGEIPPEARSRAKAVTYSILYGKTAHSLGQDLGVGHDAAKQFIDAFFARFPGVRAYIDRCVAQASREGEVRTLLGRRRPIPEFASHRSADRALAERLAVNTTVQGTAADLIKLAMVRVDALLAPHRARARLLLQIHDELLLEVERPLAGRLVPGIRKAMEEAHPLSIPLLVHLGQGDNWREAAEDAKP
ncbi:MAG: DNA polymerase I [Planctomycetes bacterium]|nr:DNA polymerase I [Planctomycetota bacterium]